MRNSPIAFAVLSLLLAACATGTKAGSNSSASANTTAVQADQARLTQDEITAADLPTAYDLVDRLRRPWLRGDKVTGGEVVVYMDRQNLGGASKLRDIPSAEVAGMEYLQNEDAIHRWGSDIKGSVIVITRRR